MALGASGFSDFPPLSGLVYRLVVSDAVVLPVIWRFTPAVLDIKLILLEDC